MMMPMIGGMHSKMRTGDFFFSLVASQAPPTVATICTAPNGMLKRIVVKESKPNDLMMSGPKVEMPPLGMETAVSMENQSHVFMSSSASIT
jgi:hypothetical protein